MTQPAANPLSASEPWNLVADGYAETTMLVFEEFADEAIAASKLKPNSTVLDVACGPGTLALRLAPFPSRHHRRILGQHGQRQRADSDDEEGTGRSVVARKGKACAVLAGRNTAYAEEAADFGCMVGGGGEVMTAKSRGLPPIVSIVSIYLIVLCQQ